MQHVSEPWKVEPPPTRREIRAGRDPHAVFISTDWTKPGTLGRSGRSIAKMTGFGLFDAKWTAENRATAARIVQCVNACAGVPDPARALAVAQVALRSALAQATAPGQAEQYQKALAMLSPPPT